MKLIILFWLLKLVAFGGASTTPCEKPDCGEKQFLMKDVKFNINMDLGEISSKSKTKCDSPPANITRCGFTAVNPRNVLNAFMAVERITLNGLEAQIGDSLRCKIDDFAYSSSGNRQIGYDIHTVPDQKKVFIEAPQSKCFSFSVRAANNAKIVLTDGIYNTDTIEIILGTAHNTKISYDRLRMDCPHDIPYPPPFILDPYGFVDFWICWESGTVVLGQGEKLIITESEKIEALDDIKFIGLETTHNATGIWKIFDSHCPGCYDVESTSSTKVSCVKVQDTCKKSTKSEYSPEFLPEVFP